MLEVLRIIEVLLLAAACSAILLRQSDKLVVGCFVAFVVAYAVKTQVGPTLRYAGPADWRSVYLVVLAMHAIAVMASVVALTGWIVTRRRAPRAARWRKAFSRLWLLASAAGVGAYVLFSATN